MANQHTTLRDVLTQTKPNIPYNRPCAKDTRNTLWPDFGQPITVWHDFNLPNLDESYGHILDLAIPGGIQLPPAPGPVLTGVSIDETRDIRHLTCWNDQVVQPTVDFARRQLGIEPGIGLVHTATTVDRKVLAKLSVRENHVIDHLITLDDLQPLVVGIGRATGWSARELIRRLPNPSRELLWPVRQLAQLCKLGQTRYGYIQTNDELAVCRVSLGEGLGNQGWEVEIQSIPWARNGCDALTTDLALWWLCMLALSGQHHRAITPREDMVSISAWNTIRLDDERGWVRRHQYSQIEVPATHSPPPPYQTPPPGNAAAFEADVGLNIGDDFPINGLNMEGIYQAGVNNNDLDFNSGLDSEIFNFITNYDVDEDNHFLESNVASSG